MILAVMAVISGLGLFFEDQFTALASLFTEDRSVSIDYSGEVLRVAYLFAPENLNPFSTDPAVRNRLNDVYETLVRPDQNLNMEPLLAVSYGLVTEQVWNFKIRKGVYFHDGRELRAQDVMFSFNQARARPGNVAAELVAAVESVELLNERELNIRTRVPDPLLLTKLARLPIVPEGFDDFERPVGTGPYMLIDADDMARIKYARFNDYWGKKPYYGWLEILSQPDRNLRVSGLLDGSFDFLADVPPDAVAQIETAGYTVKMMPSLEVGFVLFNFSDKNFARKDLREAVARAVNKESFLDLAYGFANEVNQFVPSGVFGYNPDLVAPAHDANAAAELVDQLVSGFQNLSLDFYYPQNLRLLGQYFSEQLLPVGIELKLYPLGDLELQEKFLSGQLGFYYLGWRHDSGDALPFLKAVLHSRGGDGYGIYNGSSYANRDVDLLIERSETNFNEKERLADMQEAMRLAVQEDLAGLPLFESMSIFAYAPSLQFIPRVDSLIFPSSISKSSQ